VSRTLLRACLPLALLMALGPVSPASAEKWTGRDARGDVAGYTYTAAASEDECPTFTDFDAPDDANDDITRVVVRHTKKSIVIRTVFRDLDPALDQSLSVHLKTPDRGWFVDVDRSEVRPGKFKTFFFLSREPTFPDPDEYDPDPPVCGGFAFISADEYCKGRRFSIDLDHDVIEVVLPRSCFGSPRWVRVGAGSSGFVYLDPPADQPDLFSFNGYLDYWDPAGTTRSDWLPPFGPRIRPRTGLVS